MRRRPILIAGSLAVLGLAALGTVMAQNPSGGSYAPPPAGSRLLPPQAGPVGKAPPVAAPVYSERTSNKQPTNTRPGGPGSFLPPPTGGITYPVDYQSAGGVQNQKSKISSPGIATGDIKPAGGFDLPPPSLELPLPAATPAPTWQPEPLPPAPLPLPTVPALPASPTLPPPKLTIEHPTPTLPQPHLPPPLPGSPVEPSAPITPPPSAIPTTPAPVLATGAALPAKVSQNVTVEAICPEEVVFNTEFRYELIVRNEGTTAVQNVRLEDVVPASARYIGSDPPAELNAEKLVWFVGAMEGRTEKRIVVRLRPTEEGELRSRAAVSYTAAVEARTKVTRPRVAVSVSGPEQSKVGDETVFRVKVTNSGTGPAQQMVLQAQMSDGLYHPEGLKLETKLANLAAGDSKMVDLPLSAARAGLQWCQITVSAEGTQDAVAKAEVSVVEPRLLISHAGPAKCLVRAEPTYTIKLSNPGTASTDAITLYAELPDGFDFVEANNSGAYSADHRTVIWRLAALPANGTHTVGVKLRAAAAGDVVLRTVAVSAPAQNIAPAAGGAVKPAGRVLKANGETAIKAEGVAAIRFEVKDIDDPVEVGKEAVYEIRITNQGTGVCTNVQIAATLAEGTSFSNFTGQTNVKANGQTLVFDPIATLPVKGEVVYTVRVKGNTAGEKRFRVQLSCDQNRTPMTKEESTNFYEQ